MLTLYNTCFREGHTATLQWTPIFEISAVLEIDITCIKKKLPYRKCSSCYELLRLQTRRRLCNGSHYDLVPTNKPAEMWTITLTLTRLCYPQKIEKINSFGSLRQSCINHNGAILVIKANNEGKKAVIIDFSKYYTKRCTKLHNILASPVSTDVWFSSCYCFYGCFCLCVDVSNNFDTKKICLICGKQSRTRSI